MARASKLPEESKGFLRVVQEEPIEVGIVGHPDVMVQRSVAGYVLMHEQDAAQLVRNTAELQRLTQPTDDK